MTAWGVLSFVAGTALVVTGVTSVTGTLLIPRGRPSRLTRVVESLGARLFTLLTRPIGSYERVDYVLAAKGPLVVIAMLWLWLSLVLVGYALMLWSFSQQGFGAALREISSSMLTLGFASPAYPAATILHLLAAATGLGILTMHIAYLPALYAAFNRRETTVATLESRAGSPAWGPEVLARHQLVGIVDDLHALYEEWEGWAADVAETHTTYPVLINFRSPHPLRSWLIGLLAILDAAAIHLAVAGELAPSKARLCIRTGTTCLRDLANVLQIPYGSDPKPDDPIQVSFEDFALAVKDLQDLGFPAQRPLEEAWEHFRGWRVNYETIAYALAALIGAPPAPWSGSRHHFNISTIHPDRPPHREPEDHASSPQREQQPL